MKILLSHGYFLHEDEAERRIMMPYPPQGILHLSAYLEQNGVDCDVYDTTFKTFKDLTEHLKIHKPGILGLYVNLMTRINILKIIRFIRRNDELKETIIVLGGPDVRYHTDKYLENGADYCIPGEGEITMLSLVTVLDSGDGKGRDGIRGLNYINDRGDVHYTGAPDLIKTLDDLPFPDFDEVNIRDYLNSWGSAHGYSSISVSTMRGCPYTCKWCSKAVFGTTYRRRSPVPVVDELVRLKKKFGPVRFWMVDDVFTMDKAWLREFAGLIGKREISISYECITRADRMDEEVISLLKQSGCFRVWIGAESGSQEVLDRMDRRVDAVQVREMIRASKEAGLETGTFLMLAYIGETEKNIRETLEHLKDADPDHFTITMAYPIPGTEFYNEVQMKDLKVPGEWGTYTDREINYNKAYSDKYYRNAIRYIHHEMRAYKTGINKQKMRKVKHKFISVASRSLMRLNRLT